MRLPAGAKKKWFPTFNDISTIIMKKNVNPGRLPYTYPQSVTLTAESIKNKRLRDLV